MAKKNIEQIAFNDKKYCDIVGVILKSQEFKRRKTFKHHENCSLYQHCIEVSYTAYRWCKKLKLDYKAAAIGGILHDFYTEPWQDNIHHKDPFFKQHGFVHARNAMDNAYKFFPEYMNDKVANIILRHMFPLNIHPPKYIESWIVSLADKKVSLDVLKPSKATLKYLGITKKKK